MTDIEYLKQLPWRDLDDELKGMRKKELQAIAQDLSLPIRYGDGSLKPADILRAAIYQCLRG